MSGFIRALKAIIAGTLLVLLAASPASAVTIRDLLNLKAAGLSDDILIALIQTDGSVFYLTAEDVISLHKQGMSERVLLAMIETGRKAQQALAAAPIEPPAAPVESPEYQQLVQPPVTLQVNQYNEQYVEQPQSPYASYPMTYPYSPFAYPIAVPVFVSSVDRAHVNDRRAEPVYWGFGGQRRPDSWDPKPAASAPPRKRGGK